ncbi:nitrogen regulation protein NR(I) [Candidatus Endobugula sertula]|uniref:DNA-binding transcriptional regulator NtrC n=1 Tax=Candidatus Endobugula sertula TaxID=62101 RepID=A0A1D2QQ61_9GAMM|nr:nitrogen regulation protein NR(I) [Candidatus Endobugula sertula]
MIKPLTTLWIIDDDRSIRWVLEKALQQEGLDITPFDNGDEALKQLVHHQPTAILSDVRMSGINGLDLLKVLQEKYPQIPVIIMTAHSDLESAVAAYQGGAFEYLPKPFDIDEATGVTRRAIAHSYEINQPPQTITDSQQPDTEMIGEAPAMQKVFRAIGRLSQSNITVLINGESGTGKELVAHALHRHSPRKEEIFIPLNMAAIPKDLIESELFGHEKGAFTGATMLRQGRFEQANGGTLFLDEIGDMPADTQTRLLRVLADGEFYRVGGHTPVKVDVRIIAATHQHLEELVDKKQFREDLFHRLNVIRIHIPKLSDRREDIPKLTELFFKQASADMGIEPKVLLPDTQDYLYQLAWPGNVRQLENTCRWVTVMSSGREVHISDLPPELLTQQEDQAISNEWDKHLRYWAYQVFAQGRKNILKEAVPVFEKILINAALQHTSGHKSDAAELLGWGRNTLARKLKELDIK